MVMTEEKQEQEPTLKQKHFYLQSKKDWIKFIRSILEWISLIVLGVVIFRALFVTKTYQPYDRNDPKIVDGKDHGLIALSYFGVDREGTDTLISLQRLEEELTTLKKLGYVTVSQKDVENYYYHKKPLPKKALFLVFEDGRRDTVLFTEKLLERLNYQATILTYAEKFKNNDQKFVSVKDLKRLSKEGFWELGTNGYRLSYINTYDRYHRFLGELDSREFIEINQYIGRNYNHYLMDYERDRNGIPIESTKEMKKRIDRDYQLMKKIYSKQVGKVPDLYAIMHSNTSRYGDNANVSAENAVNLESLFKMNINREGYSFDNRKNSIYDLTRMEVQAWWYQNHLLMRVKDDLPKKDRKKIKFVKGNVKKYQQWKLVKGAAEFKKDTIALTSDSESNGLLTLKKAQGKTFHVKCELLGNKIGQQTIYLGTQGTADKKHNFSSYLSVSLENNKLYLRQKSGGTIKTLFKQDMYKLHDDHPVSIPEDKKAALVAELKTRGKFAKNSTLAELYQMKALKEKHKKVKSVKQGAKEYIPEIQINDPGDVKVDLMVTGNKVWLTVDGKKLVKGQVIKEANGGIALESAFGGFGESQRNIADDVYDGAFQNLVVTNASGSKTYVDERLHGWELAKDKWDSFWNKIVDWFIVNL